MKYMIVFSLAPENVKAGIKRFLEAEPLEGIKRLGRWHEFGTVKGFDLVEADDPLAIARLNVHWADLVDMKVVPVIGDEDMGKVLSG